MRLKVIALLVALAIFAVQVPVVLAQGTLSNWAAVQGIQVDERVIVKQKDGKTVEGRMIEASETNLTISRDKKVVNISRSDIREVYHSTGKAAKGKWALIGTGIGAAAGAGLGAIKYDPNRDDYEIYPVMGFFIGAGAGALAGLAFGASRRSRTLVYQAQ
jgi:hypothetical protein